MNNSINSTTPIFSKKELAIHFTLLAIVIFFFTKFSIQTSINDDVMMNYISSGYLTGNPDEHLLFVHFFFGLIISKLYSILPGIPWYASFFILVATIQFIIQLHFFCVRKRINALQSFPIYLLFVFVVIDFQFTIFSLYSCFTTIIFFLDKNKINLIDIFLININILLATMVRFQCIIVFIIFFIFILIRLKDYKKLIYYLKIFSISVALSVSLNYINTIYYKSNKLFESYLINNSKWLIRDNPNRSQIIHNNIDYLKWSENDIKMFVSFFINDDPIFISDKVEKLSNNSIIQHIPNFQKIKSIFETTYYFIFKSNDLRFILVLILFQSILLIINKISLKYYLFQAIIILLIIFAIQLSLTMKTRVLFGFYLLFFAGIYSANISNYRSERHIISNIFYVIFLFVSSYFLYIKFYHNKKLNSEFNNIYNHQEDLNYLKKYTVFGFFAVDYLINKEIGSAKYLNIFRGKMVYTGWLIFSPFNQSVKDKHFTYPQNSILKELTVNPNMALIIHPIFVDFVTIYLFEHLNIERGRIHIEFDTLLKHNIMTVRQ